LAENDAQGERVLPDGWVWTTIGEITQPVEKVKPGENPDASFTYLDISSIDNQSNRIAEPKVYYGAEAPSRARQLVQANDVLFSTVRTYLKNIALVPEAYDGQIASTGFSVLRSEPGVSPKYLFYYALTDPFLNKLGKLQRGTSYPAVRDGDVRAQLVPLAPLPEQRRIVAEIETQFTRLDAAVAGLERAQANIRRYKAAVLKAACEGQLVPTEAALASAEGRDYEPADQLLARILAERRARWETDYLEKQRAKGREPKDDKWKQKYKEPAPPDREELPELPEGWAWTTMAQTGSVIGGLTKNSKRKDYPLQLPYLRVANVYADELRLDDVREIGVREKELERVLLKKGDLLVVEGNGSIEQIGRVALWNGSIEPCVHQNHIIKVRFTYVELGKYILLWLLSMGGREHITRVASSTSGLYTLSLSKVSSIPIPLPTLLEQRRIVAEVERRLSLVAALEASVEAALARAGRLRQAVLKQAFEGRLVPQDPDDEPASVLLERIRAQREARTTAKGKQKVEQMRLPTV